MDRHKKEQQGPIWRKIHLKNLKMKAKDGRVEEGHYLRERAAPGGRAVAWGSVRVRRVTGRGCCGNDLIDARSPRTCGEEKGTIERSKKTQQGHI